MLRAKALCHLVEIVAQFSLLVGETFGSAVMRIARALSLAVGFVEQLPLPPHQITQALNRIAHGLPTGPALSSPVVPLMCMFSMRPCSIASISSALAREPVCAIC